MKRLILLIGVFVLVGCAGSIQEISKNYSESSQAVKEFAKISVQDWLFGSGIIQGALEQDKLPSWVFAELKKIDKWVKTGDLTEFQHGYIVGIRLRMASPIIKAAIEQYAPGLLNIREVITVLSFLGG